MYTFLADTIVAVHFAYIGFVLFGQIAILIGAILGWKWIRNCTFRWVHLTMICIVAAEAIVDFECPLTTWERSLRKEVWRELLPAVDAARSLGLASCPIGEGYLPAAAAIHPNRIPEQAGSFIGRYIDALVFTEWPEEAYTPVYIGFALVVILTFIVAPPRRKSSPGKAPASVGQSGAVR